MAQKNNFTLRLDEETRARLDSEAQELERSTAWVATLALKSYLDQRNWIKSQLQAEAANGPAISHEVLMQGLERLLRENTS